MNRIKAYGYALLVAVLLIASSMPIAYKLGSSIPTITFLFYISVVGTVTSFLMMLALKGTSQLRGIFSNKNLFFSLLVAGAGTFVVEPLALAYAGHYVSADLIAVIFRTWPIMLILLAPFVIRERITSWDMAGVVVGFLGLGVTLIGGTAISIPLMELPFVGFVLVAAFGDALTTAISKRYNYDLSASVFAYNVISLAVFAPLALATNSWQIGPVTPGGIFAIAFLGIFTEAVFAYMFYETFRLVKTSLASTTLIMTSFLTMLLSAVSLAEPVKPYYVVIAITVVAGVLIQKFAPKNLGNFLNKRKETLGVPLFDVTAAFIHTKHPMILKTMRGNGRVLAFSTKSNDKANGVHDYIETFGGENAVVFTDRTKGIATINEIDFIREIMGCRKEEMIVLGSGDPDEILERFLSVKNALDTGSFTPPLPKP